VFFDKTIGNRIILIKYKFSTYKYTNIINAINDRNFYSFLDKFCYLLFVINSANVLMTSPSRIKNVLLNGSLKCNELGPLDHF